MVHSTKHVSITTARTIASKEHKEVCHFLCKSTIRKKLPEAKTNEMLLFKRLLDADEPVSSNDDYLIKYVGQATTIHEAQLRLNKQLTDLCHEFNILRTKQIVIEVTSSPNNKRGGLKIGRYLTCRNLITGTTLQAKAIQELLSEVWADFRNSKHRTKSHQSFTQALKKQLLDEARHHFLAKVNKSETDYQPLALEILSPGDADNIYNGVEFDKADCIWKQVSPESLLNTGGIFIISSDTGTGKTTLLRHLQIDWLEHTDYFPIFFHAADISTLQFSDINDILLYFFEKCKFNVSKRELKTFISRHTEKLIFLIDGLDQINGEGSDYTDFAERLLEVFKKNLILTSRPFAVATFRPKLKVNLVRLKPFDLKMTIDYFGDYYNKANELCIMHPELMEVPMLAYMVKLLLKQNQHNKIANLAQLYKAFIGYVITGYKHEKLHSNEDTEIGIRQSLGQISYESLNLNTPFIQRIPLAFCREVTRQQNISLDKLFKYGLVDLIVSEEKMLDFGHQTYQEYLAAEWISQKDDLIDHVLDQIWNPKWEQIIVFLASIKGEEIIARICSAQDNIIQSNLFLSARLIPEVNNLSSDLKTNIFRRLQRSLSDPMFSHKAEYIKSYCKFVKAEEPEKVNRQVIQGLISKLDAGDERFRSWAATNLAGIVDTRYEKLIDQEMTKSIAAKLINSINHGTADIIYILGKLAPKLDQVTIQTILSHLDSDDHFVVSAAINAIEKIAAVSFELKMFVVTESIVNKIAACIDRSNSWVASSALHALASFNIPVKDSMIRHIIDAIDNPKQAISISAIEAVTKLVINPDRQLMEKIASKFQADGILLKEAVVQALCRFNEHVDAPILRTVASHFKLLQTKYGSEQEQEHEYRVSLCGIKTLLSKFKSQIDESVMGIIISMIEDCDDPKRRSDAQVVFNEMSKEFVSTEIIRAISAKQDNHDDQVVINALNMLVTLYDKIDQRIVEQVFQKLKHRNPEVVCQAMRTLGFWKNEIGIRLIEELIANLEHENIDVIRTAAWELTMLKNVLDVKSVKKLAEKLTSERTIVVCQVMEILSELDSVIDDDVITLIASKLESYPDSTFKKGDSSLKHVNREAVERSVTIIRGENDKLEIMKASIYALRKLKSRVSKSIVQKIATKLEIKPLETEIFDTLIAMSDKLNEETKSKLLSKVWSIENRNSRLIDIVRKMSDNIDDRFFSRVKDMLKSNDRGTLRVAIILVQELRGKIDRRIIRRLEQIRTREAYNLLEILYHEGKLERANCRIRSV